MVVDWVESVVSAKENLCIIGHSDRSLELKSQKNNYLPCFVYLRK